MTNYCCPAPIPYNFSTEEKPYEYSVTPKDPEEWEDSPKYKTQKMTKSDKMNMYLDPVTRTPTFEMSGWWQPYEDCSSCDEMKVGLREGREILARIVKRLYGSFPHSAMVNMVAVESDLEDLCATLRVYFPGTEIGVESKVTKNTIHPLHIELDEQFIYQTAQAF